MKRGIILIGLLAALLLSSCSLLKRGAFSSPEVSTGLDILVRDDFIALRGKQIGLIANHSAVDRQGKSILDLMLASPNVTLKALFAPEHGFGGSADEVVKNSTDEKTGLAIYSLYDDTKRPTADELKGIDCLIFDIQDIGARFYTYTSSLAMCMEEAAVHNIEFIVLDRPNPIGGLRVDGPIQDPDLYKKFTGYFPMPIIHGMTIGELAGMYNEYYGIQCRLTVIEMEGWRREMPFEETRLPWINPSPNIRNVTQAILYPATALVEAWDSNVSVGRGTETPFEILGAPWINAEQFAGELAARAIPGVSIAPAHFTPDSAKFKDEECHGVKVTITNRSEFDTIGLGLNILSVLTKMYPDTFKLEPNHGLVGSMDVIKRIRSGEPVPEIRNSYAKELGEFIRNRNRFILYRL
ncbi:MAG TPA: DUF1343 domain-containing protein [Candidatus Sumerlaeota bacterium]|nr:DUF1343 domain-containing protein [Candidatus Sumerlaeota bacterium]